MSMGVGGNGGTLQHIEQYPVAQCRDQQQKANGVGDETGKQQQDTAEYQHHPLQHGDCGYLATTHGRIGLECGDESLGADEEDADGGGQEGEENGA